MAANNESVTFITMSGAGAIAQVLPMLQGTPTLSGLTGGGQSSATGGASETTGTTTRRGGRPRKTPGGSPEAHAKGGRARAKQLNEGAGANS